MGAPQSVTLEKRCAVIFGSIGFLAIGVGLRDFVTQDPTRSLLFGLASVIALGYLGYWIGFILARPAGGLSRHHHIEDNSSMPIAKPLSQTTGEEVFLKQVGL